MPLDWLFGSKKKSEPETTLPADPPPSSGDDFVLLDGEQPNSSSSGMVYPVLPYAVSPQAGNEDSTHTHHEPAVQSYLSGVPFKLTVSDYTPDLNAARASQAAADIFLSYLKETIHSGSLSYDFQVEKSVLQEAGCRDLG